MTTAGVQDVLEVIVLSVEDAVRAEAGGATRVEVVRDIHEDGLTPDVRLVEALLSRVRVPLRIMVRPRNTFVVGDATHRDEIARDAAQLADLPVDIVTGYIRATPDGGTTLDEEALGLVAARAPRARITVHRAVERVSGDLAPLLRRWSMVDRVLSAGVGSGWAQRAVALADLQARVAPVRVIVGGGVSVDGVDALAAQPRLRELHVGRIARADESYEQPVSPEAVAALRARWFGRPEG